MPVLEWAYWDFSWNPLGGCLPVDPSCDNCYAAQCAGTKTWPFPGYAGVHDGVTVRKGKKRVFNGKATAASKKHPLWTKPLRYKGAKEPKLGSGKRSIIFVEDMGDLFLKNIPTQTSLGLLRLLCFRATSACCSLSAPRGWPLSFSNSRRSRFANGNRTCC